MADPTAGAPPSPTTTTVTDSPTTDFGTRYATDAEFKQRIDTRRKQARAAANTDRLTSTLAATRGDFSSTSKMY